MRDLKPKIKWLVQSISDLLRHEGFRQFAYPDPLSKLGKKYVGRKWQWGFVPARQLLVKYGEREEDGRPWTVGVGFTRGITPDSQMSLEFAQHKLEGEILEHTRLLDRIIPEWTKMPLFAQTVLVNLAYNLGTRLIPFGPTLALFKNGDYAGAAARLRKTPWFKQVGDRAEELCTRLETGSIDDKHLVK